MPRSSNKARLLVLVLCMAAVCGLYGAWLARDDGTTLQAGNVVLARVGETGRGAVTRVILRRRVVALSIDDGPDPRFTPGVLSVLRRHRAPATFLVLGAGVLAHPRLIAAEVRAGDEVANHTFDHPRLHRLGQLATRREIDRGRAALIAAGAPDPTLFRAPFGEFTPAADAAATRRGELMVGWSLTLERALDGRDGPAAVAWMMRRLRPGTIILAHDGLLDRSRTVAALPLLLDQLAVRGYSVVTVSELLRTEGNRAARRLLAPGVKRNAAAGPTERPRSPARSAATLDVGSARTR